MPAGPILHMRGFSHATSAIRNDTGDPTMKSRTTSLLAAALLLGGIQTALAADIGTNAGIDVNNEATVNYSVNSISQTAQTGNTTFKVDRKVDVVVSSATVLDATPGETGKLLLFTVTNKTNDTLDFNLTPVTGGDVTATGLTIYIDDASAGTLGVLDAAEALSPVTSLDDVRGSILALVAEADDVDHGIARDDGLRRHEFLDEVTLRGVVHFLENGIGDLDRAGLGGALRVRDAAHGYAQRHAEHPDA